MLDHGKKKGPLSVRLSTRVVAGFEKKKVQTGISICKTILSPVSKGSKGKKPSISMSYSHGGRDERRE